MELLKTKEIQIGDKTIPCKLSIRASILFAEISGKDIQEVDSLKDMVVVFYCSAKACGFKEDYEAFLDLIDDYPQSLISFKDAFFFESEKKQ